MYDPMNPLTNRDQFMLSAFKLRDIVSIVRMSQRDADMLTNLAFDFFRIGQENPHIVDGDDK